MTARQSGNHGPSGRNRASASLRRAIAAVGRNMAASIVLGALVLLMGVMARASVVLAGRFIPGPAVRLEALPDDGEAMLSWVTPGDGFTGVVSWEYRQRLYADTWGDWQKIPGGANVRKHAVAGLRNSWTYAFSVRAVGKGKERGAASNFSAVTPSGVERRLTEIRDLLAGRKSVRDFCLDEPADAGSVRFAGGSFGTKADSQQRALEKIAEVLRRASLRQTLVVVEGHASADHHATFNLDLSEDRAEAVIGELRKPEHGLRNDRLDYRAVARGERHDREYPDRGNHNNRRVQVWVCTPTAGLPVGG